MKQKIQANIKGFHGKPNSVFGALDLDTGILVISKISLKPLPRVKDCLLITNDSKEDHDSVFDEKELNQAINAYYKLKGSVATDGVTSCLAFSDKARGADLGTGIEIDGVGNKGMEYRISQSITNSQVAVLAMCAYADKQRSIGEAVEMVDTIDMLMKGHWMVI